MKYAVIAFNVFLCIVVVAAATKGLNTPDVPSYKAEFMSDWFHGTLMDWVGLIGLCATVLFNSIAGYFELLVYNEIGSNAKTVIFGFILPLLFTALIYVA